MKINKLFPVIEAMIDAKRTICLEGSPGIGKTTVPYQIAKQRGMDVQVVHLPTARVEDFGIPFFKDGNMEFSIPNWFPCEGSKHGEKGLLIFDDRNQADTNMQKALANVLQARELNGHKMKDGWVCLSTGNRCSDRSGAVRVLGHLRNRETVIQVDVDLDSWRDWAVINGVNPEVVAFLHYRPNFLNDYKADKDINATPRSWAEGVSQVLNHLDKSGTKLGDELLHDIFAGAVGEGPAHEFMSFLRLRADLPDFQKLLEKPETFKVNESRPDLMYAIAVNIAYLATSKNIENVMAVMNKMKVEYAVLVMKMIVVKVKNDKDEQPKIYKSKGFLDSLKRYSSYIATLAIMAGSIGMFAM